MDLLFNVTKVYISQKSSFLSHNIKLQNAVPSSFHKTLQKLVINSFLDINSTGAQTDLSLIGKTGPEIQN